jgi:hypothetical protein
MIRGVVWEIRDAVLCQLEINYTRKAKVISDVHDVTGGR